MVAIGPFRIVPAMVSPIKKWANGIVSSRYMVSVVKNIALPNERRNTGIYKASMFSPGIISRYIITGYAASEATPTVSNCVYFSFNTLIHNKQNRHPANAATHSTRFRMLVVKVPKWSTPPVYAVCRTLGVDPINSTKAKSTSNCHSLLYFHASVAM